MQNKEKDPHGLDPHEPGSKLDAGKPRIWEFVLGYFPNAIKAVAEVSEYGAKKYTSMGWSTVPDGPVRYTEALIRHAVDEAEAYNWGPPEAYVDQSGLWHDMQEAWNALAKLELRIRNSRTAKPS